MKSMLKFRGDVYVELNGLMVRYQRNLVVNAGLNLALNCIFGTQSKITHMALGSSATAPDPGQTALISQLGDRRAFDDNPEIVDNVTTAIATFPAGEATGVVTEVGLFTASTGGTMFSRVLFDAPIPKQAGDELRVTWVITANPD